MKELMLVTTLMGLAVYTLAVMQPPRLKPIEPEERVILLATYAELHSDDPLALLPPPVLD